MLKRILNARARMMELSTTDDGPVGLLSVLWFITPAFLVAGLAFWAFVAVFGPGGVCS